MVTGATTADAVIVLVDGRKGVLEQTQAPPRGGRAAARAARHRRGQQDRPDRLLGRRRSPPSPRRPRRSPRSSASGICTSSRSRRSRATTSSTARTARPGTTAPPCSRCSRRFPPRMSSEQELEPLRLPVQLVLRPQGGLAPELAADPDEAERLRDYRAVAGRISSGTVRVGDRVEIFPSGIADDRDRRPGRRRRGRRGRRTAVGVPRVRRRPRHRPRRRRGRGRHASRGAARVRRRALPARRAAAHRRAAACSSSTARRRCRRSSREIESRYDLDTLTHEPAETLATNDIGRVAPAPVGRPAHRVLRVEPPRRLVPRHPSVRRRDSRRRHRARLTAAHTTPPKCRPEGGEL